MQLGISLPESDIIKAPFVMIDTFSISNRGLSHDKFIPKFKQFKERGLLLFFGHYIIHVHTCNCRL